MASKMAEQIFLVDNLLGYRGGIWMWLIFFLPSVAVMFVEPDVTGTPRDFLVSVNLICCVSILYFNYFFWLGVPASTPSIQVLTAETAARLLLVSYYGFDQIVGDGAIGSWNWFQVIAGYVFGVGKFLQTMWVIWNRPEYMAYEEEQKAKLH